MENSSYACTDACAYATCLQENGVTVGIFEQKYIFFDIQRLTYIILEIVQQGRSDMHFQTQA